MSSADFYFSFPDRVLHYDCARCNALCCRGYGMVLHERQLDLVLQMSPQFAFTAQRRSGRQLHFSTPQTGCSLLGADGHCEVERAHGKQAKPSLCRAFPFNFVRRLEDTWLVAPHLLCPLILRADRGFDVAGEHARIRAELLESGWLEQEFEAPELSPSEAPAAFLQAERQLRDACAQALSARDRRLDEICVELTPASETGVAELTELLGWQSKVAPEVEAHLLALAPTWSLESSQFAPAERRRLLLLSRLHVANTLRGQETVSLKACHSAWQSHQPLLKLLALGPLPMPRGLLVDTGSGATLLAQAVIDRMAQAGASVIDALREGLSGLAVVDRYTLLHMLGTQHAKQQKAAAEAGVSGVRQ